jgi:hypothetical protein
MSTLEPSQNAPFVLLIDADRRRRELLALRLRSKGVTVAGVVDQRRLLPSAVLEEAGMPNLMMKK